MLSRRLIRVKVMQSLYAFLLNHDNNIPIAERQLLRNIERLYELYIHILSLLFEIRDFFENRTDEAKRKFLPTTEEVNPNTRFLQNRALLYLCQNNDLLKKIAKYKINWSDETEMLRNFFNEIRNNDDYNKYMNAASTSLNADKEIVTSIISNVLYPSSLLQGLFEEKNLYWSDDFDTAMVMAIKTVKDIKTTYNHDTPLPELFPDKLNETEEKQFARDLLSRTIVHNNEFDNLIAMKADNWELERIALMDSILIKMAISELLYFPSIPIKVSLNEYIELSKQYSSPKSKLFVNGILDKLINDFKSEGKILKTGRGLIEN